MCISLPCAVAAPIETLVRQAVFNLTGEHVQSIKRLTGGVVNQVLLVATHSGHLVFRCNTDSLPCFLKEQWAMKTASAHGVLVPEVLEVGEVAGTTFMVMDYKPGTMFGDFQGDRKRAAVEIGRQLRLINSIEVDGFGFHLDWSAGAPVFTETWQAVRRGEDEMIFGSDALIAMGALSAEQFSKARLFLDQMNAWRFPPRLCHGDPNPNNFIVQEDGGVVVLDWTQVKGGVAPFYDLARLSLEDAGEFKALCSGYGLTDAQVAEYAVGMRCIALTDELRAAAWAYGVQHPLLPKFAQNAQRRYRLILPDGDLN